MRLWDVLKPASRIRALVSSVVAAVAPLAPAMAPLGWLLLLLLAPSLLFVLLAMDYDPFDKDKEKITEAAQRCNQTLFLLTSVVILGLLAVTLYPDPYVCLLLLAAALHLALNWQTAADAHSSASRAYDTKIKAAASAAAAAASAASTGARGAPVSSADSRAWSVSSSVRAPSFAASTARWRERLAGQVRALSRSAPKADVVGAADVPAPPVTLAQALDADVKEVKRFAPTRMRALPLKVNIDNLPQLQLQSMRSRLRDMLLHDIAYFVNKLDELAVKMDAHCIASGVSTSKSSPAVQAYFRLQGQSKFNMSSMGSAKDFDLCDMPQLLQELKKRGTSDVVRRYEDYLKFFSLISEIDYERDATILRKIAAERKYKQPEKEAEMMLRIFCFISERNDSPRPVHEYGLQRGKGAISMNLNIDSDLRNITIITNKKTFSLKYVHIEHQDGGCIERIVDPKTHMKDFDNSIEGCLLWFLIAVAHHNIIGKDIKRVPRFESVVRHYLYDLFEVSRADDRGFQVRLLDFLQDKNLAA